MHRPGSGFCKLGLRARAEERQHWEEEEDEKKPELGCNAEQAVHLIPLVLLGCLLILYVFSHTPAEGSVPENTNEANPGKKPSSDFGLQGKISIGEKEQVLQGFSVYSHRSLHQVQKQQKACKENKHNPKHNKEGKQHKENKHDERKARVKRNSYHRKSRILRTH